MVQGTVLVLKFPFVVLPDSKNITFFNDRSVLVPVLWDLRLLTKKKRLRNQDETKFKLILDSQYTGSVGGSGPF
jgi:hypothetical protein